MGTKLAVAAKKSVSLIDKITPKRRGHTVTKATMKWLDRFENQLAFMAKVSCLISTLVVFTS